MDASSPVRPRVASDTDSDYPPTAQLDRPSSVLAELDHLEPPTQPLRPARPSATGPATTVQPVTPHRPVAQFPDVGQHYHGFELVSELGRGAFGRVYLARQTALAGRPVALKVGVGLTDETLRLAQVDHPNVVPVYSYHGGDDLQAVCMPYLGSITLADVSRRIRTTTTPTTLNGRLLTTVIEACRADKQAALPVADLPPAEKAKPVPGVSLAGVAGLHYTDAVLWIGRRLVAGLRAAHAKQIVHCDLKPANVLLSDDGRPMLLDFGIALDRKAAGGDVKIGGTWQYMAPEQLAAVRDGVAGYDERADLFAVGVILFELLTNRLPFAPVERYDPAGLDAQLASRLDPPTVRSAGGRVPPAVESIIAKCLAFDPADRYQTAADLEDDLARQLARRPLRHAPNPSTLELAGKWAGRHRWPLTIGGAVSAIGLSVAVMSTHNARTADRLAASERLIRADKFERAARTAQVGLALTGFDPAIRQDAVHKAQVALADIDGVADRLPADRQAAVRTRTTDLLLDLSRATALAAPTREGEERQRELAKAADWNQRAEAAAGGEPSRAVLAQRAWLARQRGDTVAAEAADRAAADRPLATASDLRTEGRVHMSQGQLRRASELLAQAAAADPHDFWTVFELGRCHHLQGNDPEAVTAFDRCAALDPDVPGVYFNRGLSYLRLRGYPQAAADFTRVIEARPEWPDGYLNRATAREGQKDFAGAVTDLTAAIDRGYPPVAVLFARSTLQARMGRRAEAEADRKAALAGTAKDEQELLERGRYHINRAILTKVPDRAEAEAALADFDAALEANPQSTRALQLKARALSALDRNTEAAEVLGRLLEVTPEAVHVLSGRALMLARLGERAAAHTDAVKAEQLAASNPRTVYQLVGVYAHTSRTHPEDKAEAFRLLASALRMGVGHDLIPTDRDLDPLRSDPEFSRLVGEKPGAVPGRRAD